MASFDWNRLHLHDPDWPPHARFRAAQSVSSASLLGAAGPYFLLRKGDDLRRDLALGALMPSLFYLSQAASFAFPGAKGAEYQFPEKVPQVAGVWLNERFFSAAMLTAWRTDTRPRASANTATAGSAASLIYLSMGFRSIQPKSVGNTGHR